MTDSETVLICAWICAAWLASCATLGLADPTPASAASDATALICAAADAHPEAERVRDLCAQAAPLSVLAAEIERAQ